MIYPVSSLRGCRVFWLAMLALSAIEVSESPAKRDESNGGAKGFFSELATIYQILRNGAGAQGIYTLSKT